MELYRVWTVRTEQHNQVTDPGLSDGLGKVSPDHLIVIFKAYASKPSPVRKNSFLQKTPFNWRRFILDKHNSNVLFSNVDKLVTAYNHLLKNILQSQLQLDLHVPGTMKTSLMPNMFDASWKENGAEQN